MSLLAGHIASAQEICMYGWWFPYWTAQLWDLFGQLIESALRKRNIYSVYLIMVFVVAHRIFGCSMQDLVPRPGIEPWPLHWECGVLAAGPPGKSQHLHVGGEHLYSQGL